MGPDLATVVTDMIVYYLIKKWEELGKKRNKVRLIEITNPKLESWRRLEKTKEKTKSLNGTESPRKNSNRYNTSKLAIDSLVFSGCHDCEP